MRNLMFVALLLFILHARTDAAPVYTVGLADQGISHTGSGPQTAEFAFQPQDGVSLQEYTSAGGSGGLGTFTHLVIARTVTSGGGGSSLLAVGPANASFAP